MRHWIKEYSGVICLSSACITIFSGLALLLPLSAPVLFGASVVCVVSAVIAVTTGVTYAIIDDSDQELVPGRDHRLTAQELRHQQDDIACLLDSAKQSQIESKDLNAIFKQYMGAARLGCQESLAPLERIAEDMGPKEQLALSEAYGTFFKDAEKAKYWKIRSQEVSHINFKME